MRESPCNSSDPSGGLSKPKSGTFLVEQPAATLESSSRRAARARFMAAPVVIFQVMRRHGRQSGKMDGEFSLRRPPIVQFVRKVHDGDMFGLWLAGVDDFARRRAGRPAGHGAGR